MTTTPVSLVLEIPNPVSAAAMGEQVFLMGLSKETWAMNNIRFSFKLSRRHLAPLRAKNKKIM